MTNLPRPFLITGCGRSGTAWAASLFTMLGTECLHERQYRPGSHGPLRKPESSWLAIPYLEDLPEGTPVLRIMRDPYDVVRSTMARGFLADMSNRHAAYAAKHCMGINGARDHLGRAIRWATLWDTPLNVRPHQILRTGDLKSVLDAYRYATGGKPPRMPVQDAMNQIGQKVNTNNPHTRFRTPDRKEINDHPDGGLLRHRATRYGYSI